MSGRTSASRKVYGIISFNERLCVKNATLIFQILRKKCLWIRYVAKTYGKIIILERHSAIKTIQPTDLGGVAGGEVKIEKWLWLNGTSFEDFFLEIHRPRHFVQICGWSTQFVWRRWIFGQSCRKWVERIDCILSGSSSWLTFSSDEFDWLSRIQVQFLLVFFIFFGMNWGCKKKHFFFGRLIAMSILPLHKIVYGR